MTHEQINKENLRAVQRAVEGLTGLSAAIYDGNGHEILGPGREDPVVAVLASSHEGRNDYENFLKETIRTAAARKDITVARSPFGQYHLFIPWQIDTASLVLIAGAWYLSDQDFLDFLRESGLRYRVSQYQADTLASKIRTGSYEQIKAIGEDIRNLYHLIARTGIENQKLRKKHARTKTIMKLLSNLQEKSTEEEIHGLLSEMLTFLYNVESLSIMAERGEHFEGVFCSGRHKDILSTVRFRRTAWIIAEVLKKKEPLYSDDPVELRTLELPEGTESFWLFPCFEQQSDACRLLCLFNTELSDEEQQEIREIFQLISVLVTTVSIKDSYTTRMKEMTVLNLATSGLNLVFNQPEVLYNSIVDTAVRLSKAERGSLLLAENGLEELSIKAVHGVNKWLLKDLKVRSGEGIAGRVFRESVPLISKDIEKDFSIRNKPIYKTPSFMSIPLKVGDETIGVLNISDKITGEVFHDEDLALIHYFANYASIALKGSTYYSLAEHMKELSITDPLTNLYNRRYFTERLAEEIDRSERHSLNSSLCIIDIDDFKLFNDTEGHPAGDDILIRLSRIIHDSLRAIDVLARIGGEEFAIIMPQTDRDEAYFVAERIRNTVRQKMDRTWRQYPKDQMTVSIGISTFPVDGTEVKRLIANADKALYRAKMHGKDRTFSWEEQKP